MTRFRRGLQQNDHVAVTIPQSLRASSLCTREPLSQKVAILTQVRRIRKGPVGAKETFRAIDHRPYRGIVRSPVHYPNGYVLPPVSRDFFALDKPDWIWYDFADT